MRQGADLITAGYILYGASTILIYSGGGGVDGFTLDPSLGEFLLSHPNIDCPTDGKSTAPTSVTTKSGAPKSKSWLTT